MNRKAERILSTAIMLFIKYGIKKTTMDDIAQSANVSKVTVYKYFVDKESLYFRAAQHIFSQYKEKLNGVLISDMRVKDKLYACLEALSELIQSGQRSLCSELAKYSDQAKIEQDSYMNVYRAAIVDLIEEGKRGGLIRKDLDKEMAYYYIDMGLLYFEMNMEYRDKMIRDAEFRNKFFSFVLGSVFAGSVYNDWK